MTTDCNNRVILYRQRKRETPKRKMKRIKDAPEAEYNIKHMEVIIMFGLTPYERRNNDLMFFNPFREIEEMEKKFFNDRTTAAFRTDIRENGSEYILEAELPGFKKEEIDIDVNDGCLTIKAEHSAEKDEKDKNGGWLRKERSFSSMTRSFDVSEIEEEAITASLENGILKLTLPKKAEKPEVTRKVEIN